VDAAQTMPKTHPRWLDAATYSDGKRRKKLLFLLNVRL
jgi:hypothetical protein